MKEIVIITVKDVSGLYIETAFQSLQEAAEFSEHEEKHGRKVISRARILAFETSAQAIKEAAKWRK
jgi:hypothetical protein